MKKIEYQIPAMKVVKLNVRPTLLVGSDGGESGGGGLGGGD
jgi:hypothetical protein